MNPVILPAHFDGQQFTGQDDLLMNAPLAGTSGPFQRLPHSNPQYSTSQLYDGKIKWSE